MTRPMNVLLITTDQMRWDHMGCAGNPVIRTPNLDRIAAGGTYLSRAYVNNPVCMPNRCSILTGRMPRNHGCWCNGVPLPEDNLTLSGVLAERGYCTALLGKAHFQPTSDLLEGNFFSRERKSAWSNGTISPDWTGPYYGFQYVQLGLGHGPTNVPNAHQRAWVQQHCPEALELWNRKIPSPIGAPWCGTALYPVEATNSNWLGEIGRDYIVEHARSRQPFFAWISFADPHHPWVVPEPYASMYSPDDVIPPKYGREAMANRPRPWHPWIDILGVRDLTEPQCLEMIAKSYGIVSLIDLNVGKILDALGQTGQADNTIVIFTSDHGDMLGDNGLIHKGPYLGEGVIRVPTLWRIPGAGGGARVDDLFSSIDIAPTVLELLGIDPPREMDGLAQVDLVRGGRGRRDVAVIEACADRTGEEPAHRVRGLVTPDRKMVYWAGDNCEELYDMTAEVPDAVNLAGNPQYTEDRQKLLRRMLEQEILLQSKSTWAMTCY